MNPERNQPNTAQTGQSDIEKANGQHPSQKYRPDWIIPDNGMSQRSNKEQERNDSSNPGRQDNSGTLLDNEDTLGIP